MKTSHRRSLGAMGCTTICSVVALSLARAAGEQATTSTSTASSDVLPEVVVTANKREQNLRDVGASVAAISSATLEAQQITNSADLATITPGLVYTPGEKGTPVYTIRGVGFYDNTLAAYPDVSLYLDQVPLPLPIMASLTMFDLDRVEVLKGPQGTLFGNNATGGAINFIAAKPTRDLEAGAELGWSRFNTRKASAYISGPVTNALRVRLAVNDVDGSGWQRSISRNDTLGKQDNYAGRLLVDWDNGGRLKVSLNLNGWRDRDDPQAPQLSRISLDYPVGTKGIGGTVPANLPVLSSAIIPYGNAQLAEWPTGALRPFQDNRFWQASGRLDYALTDTITVTSLSSFDDFRLSNTTATSGTDLADDNFVDHLGSITSSNEELRVAGVDANGFRWVVGGNYEHTDTFETATSLTYQSSVGAANGAGATTDAATQLMRNTAGFFNVEYDLLSDVTLKGGYRYTQADRYNDSLGYTVGPPAPGDEYTYNQFFDIVYNLIYPGQIAPIVPGQSYVLNTTTLKTGNYIANLDESNSSWNVGIDYKPVHEVLLYANVKKGYKAGSFPLLEAAIDQGFYPVTQESLLDYELGFKSEPVDWISIDGAIFYYDYTNKQLLTKFVDPIFGELDRLANVPKSNVDGAELEIASRIFHGLTLTASGTYLDAKVTNYTGVIGKTVDAAGAYAPILASFAGVPLPFSPKFQYTARGDYEFPTPSSSLDGFVGLGVTGQSSSYSTLAETAQDKSDFFIGAYALVNADAGIESADGRWRLSFYGKNIFNKYYITNSYLDLDTIVRFAGRPVEYGATIAVTY